MNLSTSVADESFVCRELNLQIRIYELVDLINRDYEKYKVVRVETEKLKNLIRSDFLDSKHIQALEKPRIDEPIIICYFMKQLILCDGNHRLLKRIELGLQVTECILIDDQTLQKVAEEFMPTRKKKKEICKNQK